MKSGYIAAALVIGSGLCLAQSEPPSLGDIARKNHAAAQHEKKARIVITDDDLRAGTPSDPESASPRPNPEAASKTANGPVAASAPDAAASQTKETKKESGKNNTPPAKNEVDQLKKELDGLKAQQEGWKGSAQRYEQKLATETSEFRRAMYQDALDNDRQNVSVVQHKIDETESKLAGAEDAASKAGAASGQPVASPH